MVKITAPPPVRLWPLCLETAGGRGSWSLALQGAAADPEASCGCGSCSAPDRRSESGRRQLWGRWLFSLSPFRIHSFLARFYKSN
jgi:hypothetical protein